MRTRIVGRRARALIAVVVILLAIPAGFGAQAANAASAGYEIVGWGRNTSGQLGNGDPMGTGWVSVSEGYRHTLALKGDGTVWAWGHNGAGELGDGTVLNHSVPTQVVGINSVSAISAGADTSLARRTDGSVWSWGDNSRGQLGDGSLINRVLPGQVPGLMNVTAVSEGGYFSLARRSDGSVWAWGDNSDGELGDATLTNRLSPVQVGGLTNVTSVSAGDSHSLARRSTGSVWSWGDNSHGQLGDGSLVDRTLPVQVPGLANMTAVSAGGVHSLARRSDGFVLAWGDNSQGQDGDGTTTDRVNPAVVGGLSGVTGVSAGFFHSLARRSDGSVWSWGDNSFGQLGDGTNSPRLSAAPIPSMNGAAMVSAGGLTSVALRVPSLGASTLTIDFGQVRVNTIASKTVTITNNDPQPVQISDVAVNGPASPGTFQVSGPSLPLTLAVGASTTFTVAVQLNSATFEHATLVISSDDPNDLLIPLTATGANAALDVSAAAMFGDTMVGDASNSSDITVSNMGTVPIGITSIDLQGINPGDFVITSQPCPAVLPAGATCDVTVVFAPRRAGDKQAVLRVRTDAYSLSSSLNGHGINPADLAVVAVTPTTAVHGTTVKSAVTVSNTGPKTAKGISLFLGAGGGVITAVVGTGWTCSTGPDRTCTRPSLINGASSKLTVSITFPTANSYSVSSTVSSTVTGDPDLSDNNDGSSISIT